MKWPLATQFWVQFDTSAFSSVCCWLVMVHIRWLRHLLSFCSRYIRQLNLLSVLVRIHDENKTEVRFQASEEEQLFSVTSWQYAVNGFETLVEAVWGLRVGAVVSCMMLLLLGFLVCFFNFTGNRIAFLFSFSSQVTSSYVLFWIWSMSTL